MECHLKVFVKDNRLRQIITYQNIKNITFYSSNFSTTKINIIFV